jgi:hypothetical protein
VNPSQIAPGAQDSVSVMGEAGTGIGTITGPGSALFAAFGGKNATHCDTLVTIAHKRPPVAIVPLVQPRRARSGDRRRRRWVG